MTTLASAQSGPLASAATWGGVAPVDGDALEVRHRVTVSGVSPLVAGVLVGAGGVLAWPTTANGHLRTTGNVVLREDARIEMVTTSKTVVHDLEFVGVNEAAFIGGGNEPIDSDVGLWVMDAAAFIVDHPARVGWSRASARDPSWLASDEIRYAPTALHDYWTFGTVRPAAVSINGTVWRSEGINVTRGAIIRGSGDGTARPETNGRAHVMIHSTTLPTIRNLELRHMGPRKVSGLYTDKVTGRYALHFHHCFDAMDGLIVENVLVRYCGSHAFVPHSTHGVKFRQCVSLDTWETPYWWDDDTATVSHASDRVTYDRCGAFLQRSDPDFRSTRDTGFNLKAGTGCRALGCVAVACNTRQYGSGFHWPELFNVGTWEFADCVAHNCRANGIFVWQNSPKPHLIERFMAYRCGTSGVRHGAYNNTYTYRDASISECGVDVTAGRRAGVILTAGSHGNPDVPPVGSVHTQRWERARVETKVAGPCCILIGEHFNPQTIPALFSECAFVVDNPTQPVVIVHEATGGSESHPSQTDFLRCTVNGAAMNLYAARLDSPNTGSTLREQRAGGACSGLVCETTRPALPNGSIAS